MADGLGRFIDEAARRLFDAPDTVCLERARLVTAAWRRHAAEPPALRRALALAHVLEHMTLDLASNPILAGNTSTAPRAWMLIPEHGFGGDGQVAIEHEQLRDFPGDRVPAELRAAWQGRSFGGSGGLGHLAVDLELVVQHGLRAVTAELDQADQSDGDPARRTYRRAMQIACNAVMAWAARYAEAAEAAARGAADPHLAALHRRVAAACRRVPAEPAGNLFEGLQAIALTHLAMAIEGQGMSVSLGLPDRALAPFAAEAAADPAAAAELGAAFLLKIAANSHLGRGSKTQAVTVGGADETGRDRCNAVTAAFLAGFQRVAVADPHLFLRCHPGLAPAVWRQACQMLAGGRAMPLLINDGPTAAGLMAAGVAAADAFDYAVIGCNELGLPGRLWDSACAIEGGLNHLELLNGWLLGLPPDGLPRTMDELLEGFAAALGAAVRARCAARPAAQRRWAEQVPTPFTSALMRGAASRGCDLMTDMPYRQPGWFERGLANAANALAALEAVAFGPGGVGLAPILAALRADHPDESLRRRLAAQAHWGNDDPRVDRWALWLLETRTTALRAAEAELGLGRHLPCHVVRSLHHLDGRRIAASPDGRRAGQPVGDSLGAVAGTAGAGPTAMLASVLRIDTARHYPGGVNVNLTLGAAQATPELVAATAQAFFAQGGQELQINVLDAATLRRAQSEPQRHADLVVRVAGLCARFVELAALEQEELIARAEAVA